MIVKCPSCASKFRVPEERLRPEGVMVRCSRCKKVFKVRRTAETEATVRRPAPVAPVPLAPPIDTEATRVVRDPLGEAGIPDDAGLTDPSALDDAFNFDLARDIPDPLLDIPFSTDLPARSPADSGIEASPTPLPGFRSNAAEQAPLSGAAATAGSIVDEDDLSSLLSLAFPKEASAEPGEGDLAVLEARTMTIAPMEQAMALGGGSQLDGLVAFDAEGRQFDPMADDTGRPPQRTPFPPATDDDGGAVDLDFDLGPSGGEPEPRNGTPASAPAPAVATPSSKAPSGQAAAASTSLDMEDFPPAEEGVVVGPRGPSGALPALSPAAPAAPLAALTTGLASLLGALVLALAFLLFLAARNDWLLDLGEMDQMLGVAFQGAQYQPRHTRTVRVFEHEGQLVEQPVEPAPATPPAPPQPLRVQNLDQRLYETAQDVHLMLVEGDLVNGSQAQQRRIFVRARLVADGGSLAELDVPVGRNLTQEELERITGPESLPSLYEHVAQEASELVLNPNQRSRFTAVFARSEGPWDVANLAYTVDVVEAQAAEGTGDWRREVFDPARLDTPPQ